MGRRRPHFLSIVTPIEPPRRRRPPPPEREVGDFQGGTGRATSLKIVSTKRFKAGYADRISGRPPRNGYVEDDTGDYERGRGVGNFLIVSGVRRLPKATDKAALVKAFDLAFDRGDVL